MPLWLEIDLSWHLFDFLKNLTEKFAYFWSKVSYVTKEYSPYFVNLIMKFTYRALLDSKYHEDFKIMITFLS